MANDKIAPYHIGTHFRIPLLSTLVVWLTLDKLQPSGVMAGVIWTIWAFFCLCIMIAPFNETWHHPTKLPVEQKK